MSSKDNSPPPSPIDRKAVLARIGQDEKFLNELIEMFFKDYREKKSNLKTAIAEKNFNTIQEIGHSIKGASGSLSLPAIQQTAMKMEQAGNERDIKSAKKIFSTLEKEVNRLIEIWPTLSD
ncbi:MAG: Hpt domain-containing protein [Candidatus Aminicenantes bacterium]|nr:Hpt domain-containing protein [Candidatus Aminicenantes bacterium]